MFQRRSVSVGLGLVIVFVLGGCSLLGSHGDTAVTATPHARASRSATATPTPSPATLPPTPPAVIPGSATPRPATAAPAATPAPSPTQSSIPQGTVVAQGDVASPKGSIHFHYSVVADGSDGFVAQYSGFTSTLPITVAATFIDIAPKVGDGLTAHGVGDVDLGGATSAAGTASGALAGSGGDPSWLGTLVTYSSSSTDATAVPIELGPNKVLAVTSVHWSVPARQTNVHPVDGGARAYAAGAVSARTASGAPRRYVVAHGDVTAVVAARFGISVEDLIWLNAGLQVFGDQQYLYEGTTINLDPASR